MRAICATFLKEHAFKNEHLFYRFTNAEDHGRPSERSWFELIKPAGSSAMRTPTRSGRASPDNSAELDQMDVAETIGVAPLDAHNAELLDNVHPRDWQPPDAPSLQHGRNRGGAEVS